MRISKTISILIILYSLMGCNRANPEYVASVEQLNDSLIENSKKLNFDITPFEERVTEINNNLLRLKNEITDTLTLEEGISFEKYKGVMKIYKRNISLYEKCNKEQKELETQLSNLLSDLKKGNLDDEKFKAYFATESADVHTLIEETKLIQSSTYELEPEFRRLSKEIYAKLPAKDKTN